MYICVLFLIKLRWPENKNIYNRGGVLLHIADNFSWALAAGRQIKVGFL